MKLNNNFASNLEVEFSDASNIEKTKNKDFSFNLIFKSNLKWAFRYLPSLILGIIFLIAHISITSLLIAVMPSSEGIDNSIRRQGTYKALDYVISCFFFFLFVLFQTTYLFVSQRREGIHNIELRAGISTIQSFFFKSSNWNYCDLRVYNNFANS